MDVKILSWPAEARERDRYRNMGVPVILVIDDTAPPPRLGVLEDYVHQSAAVDDLHSRAEVLQKLAKSTIPVVDYSDVLRFGGGWLSLSPIDARLTRVLVDSFQSVVPRQQLINAGWPGTAPRRNVVDLRIFRLRRRILPLSLFICTVRSKGYMLDLGSSVDPWPADDRSAVGGAVHRGEPPT
jgi:two-component system, OmpR family, response regulator